MKKVLMSVLFAATAMLFTACTPDEAEVASQNTSREADNFGIERKIYFFNTMTGEYVWVIEGRCSITDQQTQLEVTCKTGNSQYKKHFLGLGTHLTYFAEQVDPAKVSGFHYMVNIRPETLINDYSLKTSGNAVVPEPDKTKPVQH